MNLEFKKITSINKISKNSKVVNFSVKNNENYFANGVLTHNCYMKRHRPTGLQVADNVDDVLAAITEHYSDIVYSPWYKQNKPNQTDDHYITYDIGSNEDLALHAKYYDIDHIFRTTYGRSHLKFSFATKYVNYDLPDVSASIRIRFSLMPQKYSDVLEPETSSIIERIQAIDKFIDKGYDVHINFSPVIVTDTWIEDYRDLFMLVDEHVTNKDKVKCEVIFLTHNEKKHNYNLANDIPGEDMLWRPEIQENKISGNGELNIRYQHKLKSEYIYQFKSLHGILIPWNTIRYIF